MRESWRPSCSPPSSCKPLQVAIAFSVFLNSQFYLLLSMRKKSI
ncbi:hypothetical protein PC123_g14007 [Phytophthora cactorum]|nr:hypothetical protein PC123_g14007 [Phytophthora cactorum]